MKRSKQSSKHCIEQPRSTSLTAGPGAEEEDDEDDAERHGGYYWLAERAKGEDASDDGDDEVCYTKWIART